MRGDAPVVALERDARAGTTALVTSSSLEIWRGSRRLGGFWRSPATVADEGAFLAAKWRDGRNTLAVVAEGRVYLYHLAFHDGPETVAGVASSSLAISRRATLRLATPRVGAPPRARRREEVLGASSANGVPPLSPVIEDAAAANDGACVSVAGDRDVLLVGTSTGHLVQFDWDRRGGLGGGRDGDSNAGDERPERSGGKGAGVLSRGDQLAHAGEVSDADFCGGAGVLAAVAGPRGGTAPPRSCAWTTTRWFAPRPPPRGSRRAWRSASRPRGGAPGLRARRAPGWRRTRASPPGSSPSARGGASACCIASRRSGRPARVDARGSARFPARAAPAGLGRLSGSFRERRRRALVPRRRRDRRGARARRPRRVVPRGLPADVHARFRREWRRRRRKPRPRRLRRGAREPRTARGGARRVDGRRAANLRHRPGARERETNRRRIEGGARAERARARALRTRSRRPRRARGGPRRRESAASRVLTCADGFLVLAGEANEDANEDAASGNENDGNGGPPRRARPRARRVALRTSTCARTARPVWCARARAAQTSWPPARGLRAGGPRDREGARLRRRVSGEGVRRRRRRVGGRRRGCGGQGGAAGRRARTRERRGNASWFDWFGRSGDDDDDVDDVDTTTATTTRSIGTESRTRRRTRSASTRVPPGRLLRAAGRAAARGAARRERARAVLLVGSPRVPPGPGPARRARGRRGLYGVGGAVRGDSHGRAAPGRRSARGAARNAPRRARVAGEDVDTKVLDVAPVPSTSTGNDEDRKTFRGRRPFGGPELALVWRAGGALALVDMRGGARNGRVTRLAREGIERFWVAGARAGGAARRALVLLDVRRRGHARVARALFRRAPSWLAPAHGAEDPELELDRESYPLCVRLGARGVPAVAGCAQRLLRRRLRDAELSAPFSHPVRAGATSQPVLPCALRHLLRRGEWDAALAAARASAGSRASRTRSVAALLRADRAAGPGNAPRGENDPERKLGEEADPADPIRADIEPRWRTRRA